MGRHAKLHRSSKWARKQAADLDAKVRAGYRAPRWMTWRIVQWLAPGFARRHKERWEKPHLEALRHAEKQTRKAMASMK